MTLARPPREDALDRSGDGKSRRGQLSQRAADLGSTWPQAALVKTFKLSTNDPKFAAKAHDVVGLYLDPPEPALVLSVAEKAQIQALDRTQPGAADEARSHASGAEVGRTRLFVAPSAP